MILADTSIWVAHLRAPEPELILRLDGGRILMHPFIVGELALGRLRQRDVLLALWQSLPQAEVVAGSALLRMIAREGLAGAGIGLVDAHLLAAVRATPGARLWTRDQPLRAAAKRLGIAVALA